MACIECTPKYGQFPNFLFETKHVIEIFEVLIISVFIIMHLRFTYSTTVVFIDLGIYVVLITWNHSGPWGANVETFLIQIIDYWCKDVRCQYSNILKVSVDVFIWIFFYSYWLKMCLIKFCEGGSGDTIQYQSAQGPGPVSRAHNTQYSLLSSALLSIHGYLGTFSSSSPSSWTLQLTEANVSVWTWSRWCCVLHAIPTTLSFLYFEF